MKNPQAAKVEEIKEKKQFVVVTYLGKSVTVEGERIFDGHLLRTIRFLSGEKNCFCKHMVYVEGCPIYLPESGQIEFKPVELLSCMSLIPWLMSLGLIP